jgi:ribosomal protein S18 acetylase RimI-like enzyme
MARRWEILHAPVSVALVSISATEIAMSEHDRDDGAAPRATFDIRPARPDDYAFAEALYIDSMRPLMNGLAPWNEAERRAALRRSFKTADTSIIIVEARDVGWMQVTERDTDYNLAQLQILEHCCGRGIGTALIGNLLRQAAGEGRTVSLSAVRTNRAIGLYERLGFRILDPGATPIIDMVWGEDRAAADRPAMAGPSGPARAG